MSEVCAALENRLDDPSLSPFERRNLLAWGSRLHWHCHFVQKLESEPEIEFEPFNRGFVGMREPHWNEAYFQAWASGQTGVPLVDACMRSLLRKGWINFRMRAMLISFASFPLWLHWKRCAEHLARCFLDFEPGIHYSQVQMQAGVTGINTIRIYSPTKQAFDQDPNGEFIKRECPELSGLPVPDIFEPWNLPPLLAQSAGFQIGRDYPEPVVDLDHALSESRKRIFAWRARSDLRMESKKVYERHGSRRRSRVRPSQ
jgi:deoxyribodipyrimidine photo-lyase